MRVDLLPASPCVLVVFAAISPEPAHLEAFPSLCPQFHRGQIDFDSVRTDRQTSTDSARWCNRTGTSPSLNPTPFPHRYSLFPASLPPAYGNKLSPSRSMQGRGLDLYRFPSLISPILPLSCLLVSNWPVATRGLWWSLCAQPHQAEPEQNRLCAVRIFKINVMDIFSEENVSFACLSCMYIPFIYRWGSYVPMKGKKLIFKCPCSPSEWQCKGYSYQGVTLKLLIPKRIFIM